MSAEVGQSSRWGRGARLTRRVREEPPPGELARVYFDRNATKNGAKRSGSGGMHRRPSPHRENWAAWVSPPAGKPPWPRLGSQGSGSRSRSGAWQPVERGVREGGCPGDGHRISSAPVWREAVPQQGADFGNAKWTGRLQQPAQPPHSAVSPPDSSTLSRRRDAAIASQTHQGPAGTGGLWIAPRGTRGRLRLSYTRSSLAGRSPNPPRESGRPARSSAGLVEFEPSAVGTGRTRPAPSSLFFGTSPGGGP